MILAKGKKPLNLENLLRGLNGNFYVAEGVTTGKEYTINRGLRTDWSFWRASELTTLGGLASCVFSSFCYAAHSKGSTEEFIGMGISAAVSAGLTLYSAGKAVLEFREALKLARK